MARLAFLTTIAGATAVASACLVTAPDGLKVATGSGGGGGSTSRSSSATTSSTGGGGAAPCVPLKAAAIAAGTSHTCALVDSSTGKYDVVCWGFNLVGQLGGGSDSDPHPTPRLAIQLDKAPLLAAGGDTTCTAVHGGDKVTCWGLNDMGQADPGNAKTSVAPTTFVADMGGFDGTEALAVGATLGCAITGINAVYCWGAAKQWGGVPPGPEDATSGNIPLAAGGSHVCTGFCGDGQCFGANGSDECGADAVQYPTVAATAPQDVGQARALALGDHHSCASGYNDEPTWGCWGDDSQGQCDGTPTVVPSPMLKRPPDPPNGSHGAAGRWHTCATDSSNAPDAGVVCWGDNRFGQLGLSGSKSRVDVAFPHGITPPFQAIAAGGNHTCVLDSKGLVACWGENDHGECGQEPSGSAMGKPVAPAIVCAPP